MRQSPRRVLVSGFAPFDGETVNPSERAVAALSALTLPGFALRTIVLPTRFGESVRQMRAVLDGDRFDAVLSVGLAGGRAGLSFERVAVNLDDARIPDMAGERPVDRPVVAGAPAAYFSTLPVKAMAAAVRSAGLDASVSHSAGAFVCNHLFFSLCHLAVDRWPGLRCGFVHIPWLPEQAGRRGGPFLNTPAVVRGLTAALAALNADAPEPTMAEGGLC